MLIKLEVPEIIKALLNAQNVYDSNAYSELFTIIAIVHDEGRDHHGIAEIKKWNEATNKKYGVTLDPINFLKSDKQSILTVIVTGNFDGSPATLKYYFTFEDEKIKTLDIRG